MADASHLHAGYHYFKSNNNLGFSNLVDWFARMLKAWNFRRFFKHWVLGFLNEFLFFFGWEIGKICSSLSRQGVVFLVSNFSFGFTLKILVLYDVELWIQNQLFSSIILCLVVQKAEELNWIWELVFICFKKHYAAFFIQWISM